MLPAPYYDHGGVTIYCADCREILPALLEQWGPFDLTLTDPPYGIALDTRNKSRQRGTLHRPGAPRVWSSNDHELVRGDDGPFDPSPFLPASRAHILWGANNYASRLPDSPCWLAWDRKDRRASDSHITDCELAAVLGHRFRTVRLFRHMWAGFQRDSEVGARILHPMQKPVALMRWCLSFFPKARTVLDPFMGTGPIARACKDAGLRYVGIEVVEPYCALAVGRLAQEVLLV